MGPLKVFISYRRADTQHVAGRLGDRIGSRFTLFMDIDDIPLGVDFTTALNEAVNSSDVLVVLIGHRFFGADPVVDRSSRSTKRLGRRRGQRRPRPRARGDPGPGRQRRDAGGGGASRGALAASAATGAAAEPCLLQHRRGEAGRRADRDREAQTDPSHRRPAEPTPSRDALFRDPDYSKAVAAAYRKEWSQAVEHFAAVQRRFPTDGRVQTALAEAKASDAESSWSVV